jgi:hypothetical protein
MDELDELRLKIARLKGWAFPGETTQGDIDYLNNHYGRSYRGIPDWSRDWNAAGQLLEEMVESGDGLPDLNYVTGYVPGDMDALRYVLTMRMLSKWIYDYKNMIGIGKTGPEAISRAYIRWKEGGNHER